MKPSDGFNIAAKVTGYSDYNDIEDPSIGTVEFYLKSWLDDGSPIKFTKVKTRPCSLADFQGEAGASDDDQFFPMHFKSQSYKRYVPAMKCLDEDISIYGDFNTNIAASFMVVFEKCAPEGQLTCADPATIEEWLKFKYILTAENTENYLQTKPADERMEAFSRFVWFALTTSSRIDKVKYITFNDIELMETPIGI